MPTVRLRLRPLSGPQRAADIGGALVFGAATLPIQVTVAHQSDSSMTATVAVAVLLVAALALRRMSPGLALAVSWVGAVVQMATGQVPSFVDLAILGVLYATSAYGSRRVMWCGFASALIGSVVVGGYFALGPFDIQGTDSWSPGSTVIVLAVATLFALLLAWTVGALVRTARRAQADRAAQQLAQAHAAAEQHRARIARDMHDVVAHSLAVIVAQADGGRYVAASDPQAAVAALATISTTARVALADVRLLLAQLRHTESDGPQPTLADLDMLFAQVRSAGAPLVVDVDPAPTSTPPAAVQLAVYRIVQEALTNAMRHGESGPVTVALAWHREVVHLVVRNPVATDVEPAGDGHGIIGMRERAHLAGGDLSTTHTDGQFVVAATIPFAAGTATDSDEDGGHA